MTTTFRYSNGKSTNVIVIESSYGKPNSTFNRNNSRASTYRFFSSQFQSSWQLGSIGIFAIVLGLLNWLIKPILVFFSFPLIILTIGLFYFVINALVLYIATLIMPGVLTATLPGILFGSILISFFHWLLSYVFRIKKDED